MVVNSCSSLCVSPATCEDELLHGSIIGFPCAQLPPCGVWVHFLSVRWRITRTFLSFSSNYKPIMNDEVHHLVFPKTVKVFKTMFFYNFVYLTPNCCTASSDCPSQCLKHQKKAVHQGVLLWKVPFLDTLSGKLIEKCCHHGGWSDIIFRILSQNVKIWQYFEFLRCEEHNCMLLCKVQTFSEFVHESCIFFTLVDHDFVTIFCEAIYSFLPHQITLCS